LGWGPVIPYDEPGQIAFWPVSSYFSEMREVPLVDAKNNLSALIAEIEATGEDIVVTRHGKPAVRLVRAEDRPTAEDRAVLGRYLLSRLDDVAADHPASGSPLGWDEVKALMDEGRE
jgi:prevent-host-death family protein